jgi:hypothetical protein
MNTQTPVPQEQSLQSFLKYDFVSGEKVIFFENFSQDAVRDFPALWNTNGSGRNPHGYQHQGSSRSA